MLIPLLLGMALLGVSLWAQAPDVKQADVKQTYAKLCAGCHGADARGTQQGPGLAGNLRLKKRSLASLRTVIQKGVPAAGMPAFNLPAPTVEALAALVTSLNATAAEAPVDGDTAAGQALFSRQCATCHMVSGSGAAIAPDLSQVARTLTVDQLRESLLHLFSHRELLARSEPHRALCARQKLP